MTPIGACLWQYDEEGEVKVVGYFCRILKGPETRYLVTEKEAGSVIEIMEKFSIGT